MPPKILFLSHSSSFGGAEKCLYLLLKGMPREKYRPLAALRRRPLACMPPGGLETRIKALGIDTRMVDLRWWARRWPHYHGFAEGLQRRVAALARIIRQERVDLVLSNSSVIVEGALAARQCNVPHVWHMLEMLSRDTALTPFLPLEDFYRLMQSLSRKVVVVSNAVKAEIEQFVPAEKVEVVYTGIPPLRPGNLPRPKETLLGLSADAPVVAFVGLHSERKGVVDLVDSARLVLAEFPWARFVLAGRDGGKAREVSRRIRKYGIRRAVRTLGHRRDVADILAASDVLVLPALADPLPLAVLEAMSLGVPVVATRSGGCEEIIVDRGTGRLVPVGDPSAMAAATLALLRDPAGRKQMGRRGKERFERHFTLHRYVEDFQRLLDGILADRPAVGEDRAESAANLQAELQEAALRQAARLRVDAPHAEKIQELGLRLLRRTSIVR